MLNITAVDFAELEKVNLFVARGFFKKLSLKYTLLQT